MNKALENSLMRLLAMGNLIEPLARLQGEIRFVNEFKFENQNINISDEKAIKGLMIELKIRDRNCQVVRRRGRLYVINKRNPRFKARQG